MAKEVYDEANAMMDDLIEKGLVEAHAVVGIWKCKQKGDDIEVEMPCSAAPPAVTGRRRIVRGTMTKKVGETQVCQFD